MYLHFLDERWLDGHQDMESILQVVMELRSSVKHPIPGREEVFHSSGALFIF
jgi:hypothetical protein